MKKLSFALAVVTALAAAVAFGVGSASAASCVTVNTSKGTMTAALANAPAVGLAIDATGCDIGVYYDSSTGPVNNSVIPGARQYGVFVDGKAGAVSVDVTNSRIYDIGDHPHSGTQYGVGVYYYGFRTAGTASGTVSGNEVSDYQKGGIVVNGSNASATVADNQVTGLGNVPFIAQNGIQFGYLSQGVVRGNTIDGNWYNGADWSSTALLLFNVNANQVKTSNNKFLNNQRNQTLVTAQACPHQYGGFYEDNGLCVS